MAESQNKIYIIIILIFILIIIYLLSNYENFDTIPIQNGSDFVTVTVENEKSQTQTNEPVIQTPNSNSLCKVAFDNYDLYPSTNPFVVRGNDINWNYTNNITDYATLNQLGKSNYTTLNTIIPNYNPNDIESTKSAFNTLLQKAPMKIGCCFRGKGDESKRTVLVRTPLNPNDKTVVPPFDQYDFKFKSLDIPAGTCPVNYYGGSDDCNAFFDVYCKNILNEFQKNNYKPEDFVKYAPECACYAPRTQVQEVYPVNTPPACYKNDCNNIENPKAYIDPISRAQPCDLVVCNNIFNTKVGNVGGSVNINAKLANECGKFAPKNDTNATQTGNTGTTDTTNKDTSTPSTTDTTNKDTSTQDTTDTPETPITPITPDSTTPDSTTPGTTTSDTTTPDTTTPGTTTSDTTTKPSSTKPDDSTQKSSDSSKEGNTMGVVIGVISIVGAISLLGSSLIKK